MRSQDDLKAGRRWKFSQNGEYYAAQSLIIAGRDRETLFTPFIWNTLTHHAKEDRDPGTGIGEMSWDLGSVYNKAYRQPEGSVNFTTADAVAGQTGATQGQVALAWLMARPGVTAPIASATTPAQLDELAGALRVKLDAATVALLDAAGA